MTRMDAIKKAMKDRMKKSGASLPAQKTSLAKKMAMRKKAY